MGTSWVAHYVDFPLNRIKKLFNKHIADNSREM